VVALLSLPGFLIYLVLRPQSTLEEEYQKTLEEEALLQEIEDQPVCPGCEHRIDLDGQVCPNCHTKIRKPCRKCGRLMELPWNVCPYCATPEYGLRSEEKYFSDNPEVEVERYVVDAESEGVPEPIQTPEEEGEETNISR
jgi:RNA polymerase subunit RPABC4/transcription elongation factor Spt4